VICADPSQAMLDQLPGDPALMPVRASAQDIAQRLVTFPADRLNVIVIKEAIHHVPASDRQAVLRGLTGLLAPGGRIVIVMLPARIEYPLFTTALADIAAMLYCAGMETAVTYESYERSLGKDRYPSTVRNRYMSLLATFTDAEIENGITEIPERHPGDHLEFADRFAFIRGIRA
jgi:SAM-dependent methyltransferase